MRTAYYKWIPACRFVYLLKLCFGIIDGVFVVFLGDFGKMFRFCPVQFHVLSTGITEELCCHWGGLEPRNLRHDFDVTLHGVGPVLILEQ